MNDKSLMKWGGVSAYSVGVLWVVFVTIYWFSQGGIPSEPQTITGYAEWVTSSAARGVIFLYGFGLFLLVIVAFAAYEYLKRSSYSLALIGLGFVLIHVVFGLTANGLSVAAKLIALSQAPGYEGQLVLIMSMFGGFHNTLVLLWAFYNLFWGLAFVRLDGHNKTTGYMLLATAVFGALYYVFLRVGFIWPAEFAHMLGHVTWTISHFLLGMILTAASKDMITGPAQDAVISNG